MNYLGTEHLIVYAFLFLSLLLGLWAGRNVKNIRDYALAGKGYGTGVLTITFLATYLSGPNTIDKQKSLLAYGLVAGSAALNSVIVLVCIGIFIVPKMMRFKQSITLGDVMKELYGPSAGIITGIIGTISTLGLVGRNLAGIGYLCEKLLAWPASWSIILGGSVLIFYSSFGGVKSVTITDVFQFIVFVLIIPLIANIAISEAGGINAILAQLPADKLTVVQHEKFLDYLPWILFAFICPVVLSSPPIVQRILMTRNQQQAKHMLFVSAAFIFVIKVLLIFTCLAVLVLAPNIKPSVGAAFIYIIQHYFPPVLIGLSISGMLAVIMSTLDSFLNAGGLLFANNVLKPSLASFKIDFDELKTVRYVTFLMGCISILIARMETTEYAFMHGTIAVVVALTSPVISFPLVAGILGIKPDTRAFLTASIFTIIAFIISRFFLSFNGGYIFAICVTTNVITFLGMHILRYGGIVVVHQSEKQEQYQSYRYTHETKQLVFALFICFNYMVPYFMYTRAGETTMFAIKFIGLLLCIGLLLKAYWPPSFKKYFDTYWHFCLLYCLPFTTTVLYLLNEGGLEWTINIALAIMLLLTLVDWKRFTIISLTGTLLGLLYVMPASLSYENAHALAYSVTFSTLVGLLFARRKEQYITQERRFLKGKGEVHQANFLQATAERQATLKALQNTQVGGLLTLVKELQSIPVAETGKERMEVLQNKLIPMAFQLQGLDTRSQDYLRLHIKKDLSIEALLSAVKDSLQTSGIQASVRISNETEHQTITGDFEQLVTLLTKSIALLQGTFKEEEQVIWISFQDTRLNYPLPDVEKGYIKHVPALRITITTEAQLPAMAPSYSPDLNGYVAAEPTQDLDRVANTRIVKAHYGYVEMHESTLLYVIPADVREVRPRDMDKAYMEVDATPKRSNDHFIDKERGVDAQAQETAFLTDVATRSNADLRLVKMALELIKWYHGPTERKSGEPFYLHPLTVAHIVLNYDQNEATIIGALLHDTVEDTPILLQHIKTVFGKDTAAIVDLVTHLQSIEGSIYKIKMSASENLQMLEQAGNKQGLYVKLADRMHNMRTINGHSKVSKRKLVARETMDFFVPLAKKLGLQEAAAAFEEMCQEVFKQQD